MQISKDVSYIVILLRKYCGIIEIIANYIWSTTEFLLYCAHRNSTVVFLLIQSFFSENY